MTEQGTRSGGEEKKIFEQQGKKKRSWWRPALLAAMVIGALAVVQVLGVGKSLGEFRSWIEGFGRLAPLVFILIYIAAALAGIPGSMFSIAAGILFGTVTGTLVSVVSYTVAAAVAFITARHLARDYVQRKLAGNEIFRQLDRFVKEQGPVVVSLIRVVPFLPVNNIFNYAFGLSRIRFGRYLFWSCLFMFPGTVFYAAGGDTVYKFLTEGTVPMVLLAGLLGSGLIVGVLTLAARKYVGGEITKEEEE